MCVDIADRTDLKTDAGQKQRVVIAEVLSNNALIDVNKFFAAVPEHPKIAQVLKEADQITNIGGGWHTDHSYDQVPAKGSILLARETPPTGGDTQFLSVGAAFEALFAGQVCACIGEVVAEQQLKVADAAGNNVLNAKLDDLKQAWQAPLKEL